MDKIEQIQRVLTEVMAPRHRADFTFAVAIHDNMVEISTKAVCSINARLSAAQRQDYGLDLTDRLGGISYENSLKAWAQFFEKHAPDATLDELLGKGEVADGVAFSPNSFHYAHETVGELLSLMAKKRLAVETGPRVFRPTSVYPLEGDAKQMIGWYDVDVTFRVPVMALDFKKIQEIDDRISLRENLHMTLPKVEGYFISSDYDTVSWDRLANRYFIHVGTMSENGDDDARPRLRTMIADLFGLAPWQLARNFVPREIKGFEQALQAKPDEQGRWRADTHQVQFNRARTGTKLGQEEDLVPLGGRYLVTRFRGREEENEHRGCKTTFPMQEYYTIELNLDDTAQMEAVIEAVNNYRFRKPHLSTTRVWIAEEGAQIGIPNLSCYIKHDNEVILYTHQDGTMTHAEATALQDSAVKRYGTIRALGEAGQENIVCRLSLLPQHKFPQDVAPGSKQMRFASLS